jgi:hypothetical protein
MVENRNSAATFHFTASHSIPLTQTLDRGSLILMYEHRQYSRHRQIKKRRGNKCRVASVECFRSCWKIIFVTNCNFGNSEVALRPL